MNGYTLSTTDDLGSFALVICACAWLLWGAVVRIQNRRAKRRGQEPWK